MGARKLLVLLESFLLEHQIKMGRDALFELLAANNLLIKRRKRRAPTTNSLHWLRKYPNLIRSFTTTRSNQLWVSDITYWRLKDRFIYISFITDAYSHKIVGYQVDETLEAASTIRALQMAIDEAAGSIEGLIHHSDRGIQYCSHHYVAIAGQSNPDQYDRKWRSIGECIGRTDKWNNKRRIPGLLSNRNYPGGYFALRRSCQALQSGKTTHEHWEPDTGRNPSNQSKNRKAMEKLLP